MRKSWKRILALACAAAMIVPSTAPMSARAEELGGNIGDSVIENDNSELPDIANVILSTITDATYDFRVDPDELLHEFNSTLYDDTNMFFENDDETRTFELPSTYSFYIKSTNLLTGGTAGVDDYETSRNTFKALITEGTTTYTEFIEKINATEYYIWQPVESEFGSGEGAYVRLSEENLWVVMELAVDEETDKITKVTMEATPRLSENDAGAIWDGGIYTPTYAKVDGTSDNTVAKKVVPLFDAEYGVFDESVYVGLTSLTNPPVYYNTEGMYISDEFETPEAHVDEGYIDVKFIESKEKYQDKSRKASIVNKSTFDIAVTASVQMTGGDGLTLDDGNFDSTSGSIGAEIYLAIQDGASDSNKDILTVPTTSKTAVNEAGETVPVTGEATAHYILRGTGTDSILYTLGEIEEQTQSNIYYRYLEANSATNRTASFVITGKTDTRGYDESSPNAEAKAAWDAYIQALADGTTTRPQINIVYSFEKVVGDNTTDTAVLFANENLDTFTTALSNGIGWVTATAENTVDFGTTALAYEVSQDTTGVKVPNVSTTTAKIEIAGQTLVKDTDYEIADGAVTLLDDSPVLAAVAGTITGTKAETMKVTLAVNGVEKVFEKEITITGNSVTLVAAGNSAAGMTAVILNATPAIAVTGVQSIVATTSAGTLTLNDVDYDVDLANGKITLNFNESASQLNNLNETITLKVVYNVGNSTITIDNVSVPNS